VVMSLNRYQQLLTSLLTSVTQIDTIFFIILNKDSKNNRPITIFPEKIRVLAYFFFRNSS